METLPDRPRVIVAHGLTPVPPDAGGPPSTTRSLAGAAGELRAAAAELRMAAVELAEDARALAQRARAERVARQRDREALDGPAIRLLALRAPAPAPVGLRPLRAAAAAPVARLAA